jgi:hypothetical protein
LAGAAGPADLRGVELVDPGREIFAGVGDRAL